MGIFNKIAALFSGPKSRSSDAIWITAGCNRCGEQIRTRVNLFNDLSAQYGEGGEAMTYFCRKQLIGEGMEGKHCFQRIEIELTFDSSYRLINREITGGTFIDPEGSPGNS